MIHIEIKGIPSEYSLLDSKKFKIMKLFYELKRSYKCIKFANKIGGKMEELVKKAQKRR